jgi:hypothetical protein
MKNIMKKQMAKEMLRAVLRMPSAYSAVMGIV